MEKQNHLPACNSRWNSDFLTKANNDFPVVILLPKEKEKDILQILRLFDNRRRISGPSLEGEVFPGGALSCPRLRLMPPTKKGFCNNIITQ